jgi:hypothetical protein
MVSRGGRETVSPILILVKSVTMPICIGGVLW